MTLDIRTFTAIVEDSAAIAQAECPDLSDLSSGSPFLALLQASAYNALWLQLLVVEVARQARLATSVGLDVDSFLADFGASRLASVTATGNVTFSRYLSSASAKIVPGTVVKTSDGVTFTVSTNTLHPLWVAAQSAYVVPANTSSVTLPVAASQGGTGSNVRAGTITVISTPIAGIDNVNNALPFVNGIDAESDDHARARFVNFINTRSQGTTGAIEYAISSTQPGISFKVVTNQDPEGNPDRGRFVVFADDGTGSISDTILDAIRASVRAVKPIAVDLDVLAATAVMADISMSITAEAGFDVRDLAGPVAVVITDYINDLGVGESLDFYRLPFVAQEVPGVAKVSDIFVNGDKDGIAATNRQKIVAGTVAVQ